MLPLAGCSLVTGFMGNTTFAGRRFLHLCAHHAHVVSRRYHRKQQDQQACQGEQALQGRSAAEVNTATVPPEPIGRQGQKQPRKIQQQFHGSEIQGMGSPALNVVVFQKNGIGVNVTSVLKDETCARLHNNGIPIRVAESVGK